MKIRLAILSGIVLCLFEVACTSLPTVHHERYEFPKETAFIGNVKRPYRVLGTVRAKVNFETLDPASEETDLCRNYFHKAVRDLVKLAREKGGDAVVNVQSVVFLEDGRHEFHSTPECADDGSEGQILAQGIAVKWTN